MKKNQIYASVAIAFAILLYFMLRRPSEPNIPVSDRLEPAEEAIEDDQAPEASSEDMTSTSAERVEAMEPSSEGNLDESTAGNVIPPDGAEATADGQEVAPEGINDINLTEALSNDHLVQKSVDIKSVHCEGRVCLIQAQVKPGEDEHAPIALSQFLATHPEYGLRSDFKAEKDDSHIVSFTFSPE